MPRDSVKRKIHPKFQIEYPNSKKQFTAQYNKVKGTFTLNVIHDLSNVSEIDIGVIGICHTHYAQKLHSDDTMNSIIDHNENHTFMLKESKVFPSNMSSRVVTLSTGQSLQYPFSIELSSSDGRPLPSSCELFGDDTLETGDVSIAYFAFAKIVQRGSKYEHNEQSTKITHQIHYQGGSYSPDAPPQYNENVKQLQSSHIFKDKLKQLIIDETTQTLIENRIQSPHRHTRLVRSLWNDNYRKSNLDKVTKNVQLNISTAIPKSFNINSSLSSLPITIDSPSIINSESEFGSNGHSTKLGLFEIERVNISLKQYVKLKCNGNKYHTMIVTPLYKSHQSHFTPSFDLIHFKYDPTHKTQTWNTTLGELINDANIKPKLKRPIMNDVSMGDYFSVKNRLSIEISVSNSQSCDKKQYKFRFEQDVDVDCFVTDYKKAVIGCGSPVSVYLDEFSGCFENDDAPPPPYEL